MSTKETDLTYSHDTQGVIESDTNTSDTESETTTDSVTHSVMSPEIHIYIRCRHRRRPRSPQ